MRGLTPEEADRLAFSMRCDGCEECTPEQEKVYDGLIEQGRIAISRCPVCGSEESYLPTPAGREALLLWKAMKDAGIA
jgi:hypothetical protein